MSRCPLMLYRACLDPFSEYSLPLYRLLPLHQGIKKYFLKNMFSTLPLFRSPTLLLLLYYLRELFPLQISGETHGEQQSCERSRQEEGQTAEHHPGQSQLPLCRGRGHLLLGLRHLLQCSCRRTSLTRFLDLRFNLAEQTL